MVNTHRSNDISSICYAILEELSKTDSYPIKKCKNCSMYFIPNSRLDEIYCDYPKENKDDKKLKAEFEIWKKQAKEKITKLKHGELTEDDVYEWLQENK